MTCTPLPRLPALPTRTSLTNTLRFINASLVDGGCEVYLYLEGEGWDDAQWRVDCEPWERRSCAIHLPGRGVRFDAVEAARAMLATVPKGRI